MSKRSKNLSLDAEAIRRGERYSELHGTNVSQLVSNFLAALPVESVHGEAPVSPAVARLLGAGSRSTGVEDYRRHLTRKYAP